MLDVGIKNASKKKVRMMIAAQAAQIRLSAHSRTTLFFFLGGWGPAAAGLRRRRNGKRIGAMCSQQ
jgi:hypothetical protein